MSSTSSFEMTKAFFPFFPALKRPLSHIFLWIAPSIAQADIIVANGAKKTQKTTTTTTKKQKTNKQTFTDGIANLPNKVPKTPDWVTSNNPNLLSYFRQLSFTSFISINIFLVKAFLF